MAAEPTNVQGGAELRAWQRSLGLSQAQLGAALGVATDTVARWERGEMAIQHPKMLALALESIERNTPPVSNLG